MNAGLRLAPRLTLRFLACAKPLRKLGIFPCARARVFLIEIRTTYQHHLFLIYFEAIKFYIYEYGGVAILPPLSILQATDNTLQYHPQIDSHQRNVENVASPLDHIHYSQLHAKEILRNPLQIAAVGV